MSIDRLSVSSSKLRQPTRRKVTVARPASRRGKQRSRHKTRSANVALDRHEDDEDEAQSRKSRLVTRAATRAQTTKQAAAMAARNTIPLALVIVLSVASSAAQALQARESAIEVGRVGRPSSPTATTTATTTAVLLDTTEQSSLGWTRYPDGGPGGQGRTPGWSEESFLQMERDINWRSFVTCDVAYTSVNNWLWTPYIERGDANRLYIEIKFTMRDCNLFPQMVLSCKETFALLYNEVEGPVQAPAGSQSAANVSFAQADNYKLIDAIAADEGRFTSNSDVVINTEIRSVPVSKRGLYFAFRDQGACLSLIAIKVYSLKCPALATNLARFNATPTGRDLTSLVAVEGECVANSVQIEQPRMFCSADGQWNAMSSGQCKCLAGFEPVQNHTKCQACPPGRYKAQLGDSPCLPCPERSHSHQTGATECKCNEGYFRAPKDARSAACSQPPAGPPQNLTATYVDSTSAVIQWQAPRQTGHRDDLTYKLLCDSCDFTTLVSSPQFFTNFSETKCVLSGLQPGTSYRFVLYVTNGVSLMAAMSSHHAHQPQQQQHFSEITIQTSKPALQGTSNTLSTQNGLQLLPIYNFRAFAGARGSDMLLAWDAQQSGSPAGSLSSPSSASELLIDTALALGSGADQPAPSLYEIKFQPRSLGHPAQEQLLLARRSPYPILFDQQQQPLASQALAAQSVTTTNKAVAIYTLQPRTEYAFQVRAKWAHSSQWTDWSEPVFATTGANGGGPHAHQYSGSMAPLGPADPSAGRVDFPAPFDPVQGWQQQQTPFGNLASLGQAGLGAQGGGGGGQAPSSWTLSSVVAALMSALIVSVLIAIALVHYRNSMCLKSLSSSLSGGLIGSNVGSTYAGVYNGGTSSDLIAGVAGPLSGGNYGAGQAGANGANLIYHNAPGNLHHHHHLHATLSAGSAGALITGSNSTSRSSSGTGNVVQNFLAATLGQLAGHHHHHNNQASQGHMSTKTLDAQQQHNKLFANQSHLAGEPSPNGLLDLHQHQHQQQQRNHYHQMLGNVNHTLLFGGQQPGQFQQQPIPIVPPSAGGPHQHNLAQHLSNLQQQQLANGNSPQPQQVADLFNGHHHQQHHQQSKYGNSRTLSGQQQQQQQYGLANLHDPQVHIYDDLEVVSQTRQGSDCAPEMLKFGQHQLKQPQQQHQTLSGLLHQGQASKQRQEIYASTRELYEPTTKLVIGSSGPQQSQSLNVNLNPTNQSQQQHQQQQQQQARAKFFKERAEEDFYDE